MILVSGATGNIGRVLTERLGEAGHPVRALTRDASRAKPPAGVEIAECDLTSSGSLRHALDGVAALFLLLGSGNTTEIVESARRAGVRRIVLVSSLLASTHPESFVGRSAMGGAGISRDSGLDRTILRPRD